MSLIGFIGCIGWMMGRPRALGRERLEVRAISSKSSGYDILANHYRKGIFISGDHLLKEISTEEGGTSKYQPQALFEFHKED